MKRNWRVGIRWRYVGGLPYTPWDLEKSARLDVWRLNGGPTPDYPRLNSARFSAFHQLDTRIDKSYYLKKLTAKFYIDIQNLYNFQAEQQEIVVREQASDGSYLLSPDGKSYILRRVPNTAGTVLPSIGIILEF